MKFVLDIKLRFSQSWSKSSALTSFFLPNSLPRFSFLDSKVDNSSSSSSSTTLSFVESDTSFSYSPRFSFLHPPLKTSGEESNLSSSLPSNSFLNRASSKIEPLKSQSQDWNNQRNYSRDDAKLLKKYQY